MTIATAGTTRGLASFRVWNLDREPDVRDLLPGV
jgi:hypothetical protein